jgi:outer membrane protein assembly factor BamB
MWKTKRSPSFDKGSMILVDGLLLSTDGATKLYLIDPDPSVFKPLASAELLEAGGSRPSGVGGATQNWAPLALSDGKLLIRDQSRLMCVKVAQ